MPRPEAWADAPMRSRPPAISRPRTWCGCSTVSAWSTASTSTRSWRPADGCRDSWVGRARPGPFGRCPDRPFAGVLSLRVLSSGAGGSGNRSDTACVQPGATAVNSDLRRRGEVVTEHRAQVEELLADYRRSREQLAVVHRQLASVSASASSADGLVTATVGARGVLTDLVIDNAAYERYRPAELAAHIVRAAREAAVEAFNGAEEVLVP